jgi:GDP-D-mannose 3', 5'-epimerase
MRAGGFCGGHLVRRLKSESFFVRGVDLKLPEFSESEADDFVVGDLRDPYFRRHIIDRRFDEVYQLAADMGDAGFIFTGENDANVMHNRQRSTSTCSTPVTNEPSNGCSIRPRRACIRPTIRRIRPHRIARKARRIRRLPTASTAGQSCSASASIFRLSTLSRPGAAGSRAIHNIFSPEGTWTGGREKAPDPLCRKVAAAEDGDAIEILGDGSQTRSFLYISECIEGTVRLMR